MHHVNVTPTRNIRVPLLASAERGGGDDDETTIPLETETTRIPELEALDPASNSVIVKAKWNIAAGCMFIGGALDYVGGGGLVVGLPITMLGILLTVQTLRIRFIFGPTRISVANRKGSEFEIIRGWKYDEIRNWEVWWPGFPVLAYFKEDESYNGRGSVHFFPIMCDGAQLIEQFKTRIPKLDKSNYR